MNGMEKLRAMRTSLRGAPSWLYVALWLLWGISVASLASFQCMIVNESRFLHDMFQAIFPALAKDAQLTTGVAAALKVKVGSHYLSWLLVSSLVMNTLLLALIIGLFPGKKEATHVH